MGSVISSRRIAKKRISLSSTSLFGPVLAKRWAASSFVKPVSAFTSRERVASLVSFECHWLILDRPESSIEQKWLEFWFALKRLRRSVACQTVLSRLFCCSREKPIHVCEKRDESECFPICCELYSLNRKIVDENVKLKYRPEQMFAPQVRKQP